MSDRVHAKVSVGLIGLGFAGASLLLPALKQNSNVEIVVACDVDSTKTAALRAAHGLIGTRTTTRVEEVFTDPQVDAIFIATPTSTHLELVSRALESYKHVFCEKPASLNMADALVMQDVAMNRSERLLMIGQVLRFWPEYVKAHNIVHHGRLGEPRIARTSRAVSMPAGWYVHESQSGGVILDLALHDIDFLIWTLGEVQSVFAQGENCLGKGDAEFIDFAQVHLNFKSGAIAHVEASWAVPNTYPFSTALEICGTAGMLQVDNLDSLTSLETFPPMGLATKSAPAEFNGYFQEVDAFIKAIISGSQVSPIAIGDVLHPLSVALAAKESIRSGKIVELSNHHHVGG